MLPRQVLEVSLLSAPGAWRLVAMTVCGTQNYLQDVTVKLKLEQVVTHRIISHRTTNFSHVICLLACLYKINPNVLLKRRLVASDPHTTLTQLLHRVLARASFPI